MERALMVKTPSGEKIVGKIVLLQGKPVFYREVRKTDHAFKRFDAWSIQSCVLPILQESGVQDIYQYDKGQGMSRIGVADFLEKAIERDHGDGKQLYVSTRYFTPLKMGRIKKWINSVELIA